jgi:hypothetical protein
MSTAAVRADDGTPRPWPKTATEAIKGVKNGASAAAAEKAFGKAPKKSDVEEEAASGEFVTTWTYPTGEVLTMSGPKKTGPFTVRIIDITAPSKAQTTEKIGVGSTVAQLKKTYSKYLMPNDNGGFTVGDSLAFLVDKDKVTEIMYGQITGE